MKKASKKMSFEEYREFAIDIIKENGYRANDVIEKFIASDNLTLKEFMELKEHFKKWSQGDITSGFIL